MIFIKKAAPEKKQEEISLVRLLDTRLTGREVARSHKVVHISMLSREDGFCPREFALLDKLGRTQKSEFVNTPMRVAFDTGHALEDLLRNKWLEFDVVGDWKCIVCGTTVEFMKKPTHACKGCHNELWTYKEPTFLHATAESRGNLDILVDFSHGKYYLVEVKTIDKDEFADLKAPYAEHRVRTQLYLRAVEKSESPHARKIETGFGLVFYMSKGYGKKSVDTGRITPFKEFKVTADREMADTLFTRGETLATFRAGGPMPEGICPNTFVPRAKWCPVLKECWSGKYPAGKC